jgi:streptogramin lyase
MSEPPPSLREAAPHVPVAFDEVISRAMAKSPEDRYPSAGDLARAAKAAAVDRSLSESDERSVAVGPAAPQTAVAGGAATAYGQGQPGTYGGQQAWGQGAQQGGYGGPPSYPGGPQSYPGGGGYASGPGTAPGYVQPQKKSKLPIIALVGGTALAAIVAFVVVLALAGGDDGGGGGNPTGEVIGQPITVGKGPRDIAFGGGAVWTANLDDNSVSRVDPGTGKATNIAVADLFPFEVDFDNNALSVTGPSQIRKIDPATNQVVGTVTDTGGDVTSVAAGDGFLWIAHEKDDTVTKVSQQTLQPEGDPIKVGDRPVSIAVGEGGVWVSNYNDRTITKIESATGQVFQDPIQLDFNPGGVGVVEGTLYAGTGSGIVEIDPTSSTVEEPVTLRGASYYDVGLGSLWATYPTRGQLRRIDLETKQPVGEPLAVGKGAQGVGVGVRGVPDVWVINTRGHTITRVKPGG